MLNFEFFVWILSKCNLIDKYKNILSYINAYKAEKIKLMMQEKQIILNSRCWKFNVHSHSCDVIHTMHIDPVYNFKAS